MDSKVVVVTGASTGIGAALVRNLGAKGHKLVLAARRDELLKDVAHETEAETLTVVTDVTRRKDVEHLRDAAVEKFGHVDVWVNNAGRGTNQTVMQVTDEEFQAVIDVVLKSVLYGMQTIVPHFQERGKGQIVNVSSTLGRVPFVTYRSIYSAAKSAVNILTANLRMDLMAKYPGIHICLVLPGIVDTDFHTVAKTPTRIKAGERVGNAVVLSASEVAEHIASLLEKPVPEMYIPAGAAEFAKQYYQDVGAFEAHMAQR